MVYLDNIIIYLSSKLEYKKDIKWVLKRLYKKNMLVIIKKCKFHTKKTDFVGFIIVCTNLMVQVSHIQGHEIRVVLYARLDGGDYQFY